jgi:hypothetical protein
MKNPLSGEPLVWRRLLKVALCAAPFLFLSLNLRGGQNRARRTVAPLRLRTAIGCLVEADYVRHYDLEPNGLKVGELVWVRYGVGSIPGIGGTPGLWNIVVYSGNGQRGILLFAGPNQRGGFEAVRNGYDLVRHRSLWIASGGQGGFRLYEAVGRYVTHLSRQPRYRVRLRPGNSECTQEQN